MAKIATPKDGYVLIFRPYFTTKDRRRIYAKWFGRKSWPIRVPVTK